jgi:hypothetical protein
VFTNTTGGALNGSWLTHRFYDLLAEAGIDRLPFRNLRTTFASRLYDAGVPDHTIAQLMGHTRTHTTRRNYIARTPEQAVAAIERLVAAGSRWPRTLQRREQVTDQGEAVREALTASRAGRQEGSVVFDEVRAMPSPPRLGAMEHWAVERILSRRAEDGDAEIAARAALRLAAELNRAEVTLNEAAERLGTSPDNLRGAIKRGSLKSSRGATGSLAEVKRYARENRRAKA